MKEIEVKFNLNVKFMVIILLIAVILSSYYFLWKTALVNTRTIQGMIFYLNKVEAKLKLNKQAQPEPEQIEQPPKEVKKDGK